jgi:hypothetical protein
MRTWDTRNDNRYGSRWRCVGPGAGTPLDPFVRQHRIDENAGGEMAPLLAYLRVLQRRHGTAVLVVYNVRKGRSGVRAGQALRGSSEFDVWDADALTLTVEHRATASPRPVDIDLAPLGLALALEVAERRGTASAAAASPDDCILVAPADRPLPILELPALRRVRAATLHEGIGARKDGQDRPSLHFGPNR